MEGRMKKSILKLCILALCLVMTTSGVACGENTGKEPIQNGNRIEISDDGYLVIDGVRTDFHAENGKSAYDIYLEKNPEYSGDENQWIDDLAAGKLATKKEYSVVSYGHNLSAIVQTGTVSYTDSEVKLNNTILALNEPIVLPLNASSEWKIHFKGTYMPGGTGGGQILTSYAGGLNGRVYLGANDRNRVLFLGVCVEGQYANYCWDVDPEIFRENHEYEVSFRDGEYLLSIDGEEAKRFTSVNINQGNVTAVPDSKTASDELTAKIRAVTGQNYVKMTHVGAESHKCTNNFEYYHVTTSSIYNYKELSAHPLKDKTIFYLGSSVTRGHGGDTDGISFAEITAKLTGNSYCKEAISGTTLARKANETAGSESYVTRLGKFDFTKKPDVLVVQLSTNDFSQNVPLGSVSLSDNPDSLDPTTVTGAIEYIIAKTHEVSPDTKVVLYTCPLSVDWAKYADYGRYIQTTVSELSAKWGDELQILDLYNARYTRVSAYMQGDGLHPTKTGYAQLFVPNLIGLLIDSL